MQELTFTGERYVPSEKGRNAYEHYHRYATCLDAAAGKTVLDIASGEGFGSALLARNAKCVIGVDIDQNTVRHAQHKYERLRNVSFVVGDARALPLESKSVDLIVSFETIEHIHEHQKMLDELLRVLRRDGAVIVSSPDKINYSDKPGFANPFHVHELTHHQFVRLFKKSFRSVRIFRQRLAIASFLLEDSSKEQNFLKSYMTGERGVESGSGVLRNSQYSLVCCAHKTAALPKFVSSVHLDPDDDLYLEQERVLRWASGLNEQHEAIKRQLRRI